MTDLTNKSWMDIGETDDPNAIIESFEAEAAVTKGDPVYLSSNHKVSPATEAKDCIGIAVKSAAITEQCPVLVSGRVKVKAGGVITRGKAVYGADASKRVLEVTDQAVNEAGSGVYAKYAFHCTNTQRARVKNTHGSEAKLVGFDGIITHT